jgi:hypothetical protein
VQISELVPQVPALQRRAVADREMPAAGHGFEHVKM